MASFNLLRNSRVFFTTDVDATTGVVTQTTLTSAKTQELTILDNFSFSQSATNENITISEAGTAPSRGQRSFNTAMNPVDFSFSTYIRPYISTTVKSEDAVLWNALLSDTATTDAGVVIATALTTLSHTANTALVTISTATGIPALKAGEFYILKGVTGVGASQFNSPIKITSYTAGGGAAAFEFLTAPQVAITAAQLATARLMKCSWNENAAIAADLAATAGGGVITAYSEVSTGRSNLNQLLKFGMIVVLDQVAYAIDNCALDQAMIDFGLDGIATVQWTGKATALRQLGTGVPTISAGSFTAGTSTVAGNFTVKTTTTNYITNKLSTVTLKNTIGGSGTPVTYTVPITGGSITIANGINYITPTNLGVVNTPTTYYTGTRAISGSLTAYLRAGASATGTSDLLDYFLDNTTMIEPKFELDLAIGGSDRSLKVQVYARGASLQIPTVDVQAVLSTTINFTVQGTDAILASQAFDLEDPNDLRIRYFAA